MAGQAKTLVVNADDFGLSESINRGILSASRDGILRSTSLMPNGAAFEDAVRTARGSARAWGGNPSISRGRAVRRTRVRSRGDGHRRWPASGQLLHVHEGFPDQALRGGGGPDRDHRANRPSSGRRDYSHPHRLTPAPAHASRSLRDRAGRGHRLGYFGDSSAP